MTESNIEYTRLEGTEDALEQDRKLNQIAKSFFEMDQTDQAFLYVQFSALLNILFNKGVITQEEYAESVQESITSYNLLRHRNDLQKSQENS